MPTTITVKMFYAGNFADMDTYERNYGNENPNLVLGTHDKLVLTDVSEIDANRDGVISDNEQYSGDYLSYDVGSGTTSTALDSTSLYNADVLLGDGSTLSVPVLVIQADNGDVFISEYPANPLDNLAIQSISLTSLNTSNSSGMYQGRSDLQNTRVVCFSADTLISTSKGQVPVGSLRPGDLVLTQDRGLQPVRWVHSQDCPLLHTERHAKPVLINTGALGAGRPSHPLIVSPQHRILVGDGGQLQDRFSTPALAPAKALTNLPGIRHMNGKQQITWVHFACDHHEVVTANGCLTESLLLGPMVLKALPHDDLRALAKIFPTTTRSGFVSNGGPARNCLSTQAARQQLEIGQKVTANRLLREGGKWNAAPPPSPQSLRSAPSSA